MGLWLSIKKGVENKVANALSRRNEDHVSSGNAIFRKGKYFQVFGCIIKIFLENIFMYLVTF